MDTTATVTHPTHDEIGELRRDIQHFKSDLRQVRSDVIGIKQDAVRAARVAAAESRDRIAAGARSAAIRGRDMAENAAGAVQDGVTSHPLLTLITAFGLGVALGATLSASAGRRVADAMH